MIKLQLELEWFLIKIDLKLCYLKVSNYKSYLGPPGTGKTTSAKIIAQ